MVLAREESIYIQDQVIEEKQPQINRSKKPGKNYRFEKFIIAVSITAVFILSILILTRFATITEARYRVNHLEKQLEELEAKKQKLKIEVEMVSKSGWIESEARSRLNMDYPSKDQMIYVNVDPTKVATVNGELNRLKNNYRDIQKKEEKGLNAFFEKLMGYIKI